MTGSFNVIVASLNQLMVQLVGLFPKIIITLIIWWVGKYLINLGVKLIKKIDLKKTRIDDKIVGTFSSVVFVAGKVILILIILDYWGIGQSIISAFISGLTLTIAITLGLAFGKALEPEARTLVDKLKSKLEQNK
jgi:small-conductance mechanosensitive channel